MLLSAVQNNLIYSFTQLSVVIEGLLNKLIIISLINQFITKIYYKLSLF